MPVQAEQLLLHEMSVVNYLYGVHAVEQKPHSFRHQSGFHFRGYTNFQNSRYRSAENPMSHHEKTIHDAMVDVYCAMSTIKIAGPIFFLWEQKFTPILHFFFFLWRLYPIPGHDLPIRGFAITLIGHTTLGRTPLDEWSALRRDLYLTTHNTHKKQISMSPAGFEPANPESELWQINALHRAANGVSLLNYDSTFQHLSNYEILSPFFCNRVPQLTPPPILRAE